MSSKLPCFPAVFVLSAVAAVAVLAHLSPSICVADEEVGTPAASSTATPVEQPTSDGDRLIADAAQRIKKHASVRALIHAEVSIWDHAFTGKGLYLATRSEGTIMSRLELQLDSRPNEDAKAVQSKLLDVNDGRYLWSDRQWNGSRKVQRLDLARIRPASVAGKLPGTVVDEAVGLSGGLEPLLESLGKNFKFGNVVASEIDRVPVLRTIGVWRPERLTKLVSNNKKSDGDAKKDKAPQHLPRDVAVTLGRNDLFPYEVDFRPGDSDGAGEGGSERRASLRYRFYEVVLGAAIDPRFYVYKPGDVIVEDRTDEYLKKDE